VNGDPRILDKRMVIGVVEGVALRRLACVAEYADDVIVEVLPNKFGVGFACGYLPSWFVVFVDEDFPAKRDQRHASGVVPSVFDRI